MNSSFGRKDLCHFNEAMGEALSHGVDRMKAENPLNRQAISALNRLRNQVEGFKK